MSFNTRLYTPSNRLHQYQGVQMTTDNSPSQEASLCPHCHSSRVTSTFDYDIVKHSRFDDRYDVKGIHLVCLDCHRSSYRPFKVPVLLSARDFAFWTSI